MAELGGVKNGIQVSSLAGRIFTGLFAVICIALLYMKTLDAGQREHFHVFLTSARIAAGQEGNILAFIFSALIAFGGVFLTTEKDAIRILIFAISLPSLIANLNVQNLAPGTTTEQASISQPSQTGLFDGLFVSTAYAQSAPANDFVCDEGTFLKRSISGIGSIIATQKATDQEIYGVIAASVRGIDAAGARLKAFKELSKNDKNTLSFALGCRKPGNEFYPILVLQNEGGAALFSYSQAQQTLGEYNLYRNNLVESGLARNENSGSSSNKEIISLPVDPYISSYKFRQIVKR